MHPLEANSNPIPPVPEKRSKTLTFSRSKWFIRMLNKLSLAVSVVGRALKFFGG
jgi:hypothetical protein